MQQTISITISGKVQGVFFRQSTREKALSLGIGGKVMNHREGHVEIIATGSREQLEALLAWCRVGPPKAKVAEVNFKELPLQEFDGFIINRFFKE